MPNFKKEQVLVHLLSRFVLGAFGVLLLGSCGVAPTSYRLFNSLNDFQTKYEGMDKGKVCSLMVHREWDEKDGSNETTYRVEVSTSYEHEGQGLGKITLSFLPTGEGKILEWKNSQNGEFLRVQLSSESSSLRDPVAFRLKWIHFDHLHDATCTQLKKVVAK